MKKRILNLLSILLPCLALLAAPLALPEETAADSMPSMEVTLSGDVLSWEPVADAVKYSCLIANGGGVLYRDLSQS